MFVLGTCGHVDHGKSSLLRALTGMEPDRLPEEKKRGMTIDLGFVWLETPGGRIGIVDVPGHQRFVKNMISGTFNVDAFLFVVAADDGWMPQSQEHWEILRSLDVRRGIAVITKTDLVDKSHLAEVEAEVRAKLGAETPVVLFSTHDAGRVAPLREAVLKLVKSLPPSSTERGARLWIDRVFTPRGQGVVVTGTLREGALQAGDEVILWPAGKSVQVKSLQAYHQNVSKAQPVSRLAVQLTKVQREDIERGMLLTKSTDASLSTIADVQARFFARAPARNVRVSFHVGTLRESAMLIPLGAAGEKAIFARLKFANRVPLREGDRFVLRTSGEDETIGAGVVADPAAEATPHKEAMVVLEGWIATAEGSAVREGRQRLVVDVTSLAARSSYSRAELEKVLTRWAAVAPGLYAEPSIWSKASETARQAVTRAFAKNHEPVALKDLRKAWTAGGFSARHLERVLEALSTSGALKKQGVGFVPTGTSHADPAERARQNKAREWMAKANGDPAPFKEAPSDVKKIAREIVKTGEWVALGEEFFWDAARYAEIRGKVEAILTEKGQASTSDLKAALGLSRKIAVLLLEQLDNDRVTYLKDNVRRLLRG